jgi:hypothetical protein
LEITNSMEAGIFPVWHALAMASRFEPPPEIRTMIFFMINCIEFFLRGFPWL